VGVCAPPSVIDLEIVSRLPGSSTHFVWRSQSGFVVTVATKTTFQLAPGESELSPEQEPFGTYGGAGGLCLTDFVPYKGGTDIIVVGSAYAPAGTAVRELTARIVTAGIDKAMAVHTDRWFDKDRGITPGKPFARMPLGWDRAAGGPGTMNPIGISAEAVDEWGRLRLPNLHAAGLDIDAHDAAIEPWNFGPIDARWPKRTGMLKPDEHELMGAGWLEQPLPDRLDARFFNSAPSDQQVVDITPHLHIVLEHLHPDHVRFVTNLPAIQPDMLLLTDHARRSLSPVLDTVLIDTDRKLCMLTWRAHAPISSPDESGKIVIEVAGSSPSVEIGPHSETQALGPEAAELLHLPPASTSGDEKPRRRRAPEHTMIGGSLEAMRASALPFQRPAQNRITQTVVAPQQSQPPESEPSSSDGARGTAPPPPPQPSVPPPPAAPPLASSHMPSVPPPPAAPALAAGPAHMPSVPPPPMSSGSPIANLMAAHSPLRMAAPAPSPTAHHVANPTGGAVSGAAGHAIGIQTAAPRHARPDEIIDLLWFAKNAAKRTREQPGWRTLLKDDEGPGEWTSGEQLEKAPKAIDDKRQVGRALARVPPLESREITQSMHEAVDEDGIFERPVIMVRGTVRMTFEPSDVAEVMASVAKPFAGADKRLKDAVEAIEEVLKSERKPPALVTDGLVNRLRQAFAVASPSLPADYLDDAAERTLLEERRFAKRNVLGGPHIRTLFTSSAHNAEGGNKPQLPTYLPESLANDLPLFLEFNVRMLAEPHIRQDPTESGSVVLSVLAVARVTPLGYGGG